MNEHPLVRIEPAPAASYAQLPMAYLPPTLSGAQWRAMLWARRRASVLIMLAVLGATALAVSLWPRTYVATVTMMVNYEVNDPLNGKDLPYGQVGSYIATQVELMQTPEVLREVVERLHLTERSDYTRGYAADASEVTDPGAVGSARFSVATWTGLATTADPVPAAAQPGALNSPNPLSPANGTLNQWVVAQVAKQLLVEQSLRGSQLISITYAARNAAEAALVANTVAQVYKEQDERRSSAPPTERMRRYAVQLADLKAKVDAAQRDVTTYAQRNGLIAEGSKVNVDLDLLASIEGRWIEAQAARRQAESRAAIDAGISDQALGSNQTQAIQAQLSEQELHLTQLQHRFGPRHPDVIDAQLQLRGTREALASALRRHGDNARAGQGAARRLEGELQREVQTQRGAVLARGRQQDEAAKYRLELESAQGVYKRALDGYDQILFATASRASNVALVSRATPPVQPSKPRVLAGLSAGVALALLLGFGLPLGYEWMHRRVRCRDDLERDHGIAVLAEFHPLPGKNWS